MEAHSDPHGSTQPRLHEVASRITRGRITRARLRGAAARRRRPELSLRRVAQEAEHCESVSEAHRTAARSTGARRAREAKEDCVDANHLEHQLQGGALRLLNRQLPRRRKHRSARVFHGRLGPDPGAAYVSVEAQRVSRAPRPWRSSAARRASAGERGLAPRRLHLYGGSSDSAQANSSRMMIAKTLKPPQKPAPAGGGASFRVLAASRSFVPAPGARGWLGRRNAHAANAPPRTCV